MVSIHGSNSVALLWWLPLTRAKRVISPVELLARREFLSLGVNALEVVDVAVQPRQR